MIDLFVAFSFEEGGGFFAADAAGAEHGDRLFFIRKVSFGPVGKFQKNSVSGSTAPSKVP